MAVAPPQRSAQMSKAWVASRALLLVRSGERRTVWAPQVLQLREQRILTLHSLCVPAIMSSVLGALLPKKRSVLLREHGIFMF